MSDANTCPELLEIEGLELRYGRQPVLQDLNLQVSRGRWIALLGPNASGKTTLLHCVAGQLAPARGSVRIEGAPLYPVRPTLRRLDHAGIFVMIAGSYTPFTLGLPGAWGWGMTTAVWSIAGLGALGKLFLKGLDRKFWVGVYLALGWLVVVAMKPMIDSLAWYALALLATGGILYSTGVIFYVNKKLKFSRAIWHGHVVAAAAAHWVAVLLGVVLVTQS